MKRIACVVALLGILAGLSGCFVSVKGDCDHPKHVEHPTPDPTIAEINAVQMLSTEGARLNVLMAIAERPGLSPQVRTRLVESLNWLSTEGAREQVLMTLAHNVEPTPPQPQPMMMPPAPMPPQPAQ